MRSADIIGLITYILAFGFIVALFNQDEYLTHKLGALALGSYLIFIIIQQYDND